MTPRRLFTALARRELATGSLGPAMLLTISAGIGGGVLAGRFRDAQYGSIMMLIELDRTIAGVLVIVAVFRVISRMSCDANDAWLQQLTAAGAPRSTYVAALLLGVTAALVSCYAGGALAFAGATAVAAGSYAPAMRALTTLPLVAILLFAAASFGAAVYGIVGAAAARPTAVMLLASPWLLAWVTLFPGGEALPAWISRVITQQAPPMAVSLTIQPAARLLMYTGVTFALAIMLGQRRVARL